MVNAHEHPNVRVRSVSSRTLIRSLWVLSVAVTLSACQVGTILPDGQLSIMSKETTRLRAQLTITSTAPLEMPLIYHPVGSCTYREVRAPYILTPNDLVELLMKAIYETPMENLVKLSIKAKKGMLHVVIRRNDQDPSTYLMSNRGKLYDFNAIDPSSSERVASAASQKKPYELKAVRDSRYASPFPVNEFSLIIPEYSVIPLGAENLAARIFSEDGIPRAGYKYRGTTFFDGVRAGVFDLVRFEPMNPLYGPPVIGCSIVDLSTTLPLLVVLDSSGSKYQFERVSCTR